MDDVLVMVGGRSFQMRAAAAPKARSPTVFSLVRGATSLLDDDERSHLQVSLVMVMVFAHRRLQLELDLTVTYSNTTDR